MTAHYKPQGYSSVSPYLIVGGANRTIEFLRDAFGGVQERAFTDADGGVIHAEVRIDDTILMIADSNPEWPSISAHVHVYVADVDVTYRKALDAGAVSVQEPVRKDDDDKRGGVKGPGGITWWIATKEV
ncbi:MAG: VOC family protein [Gemmatimonadota bacterium]